MQFKKLTIIHRKWSEYMYIHLIRRFVALSLNIYTSYDEGESKYKQRVKIISDTTQQNVL